MKLSSTEELSLTQAEVKQIQKSLLTWYKQHQRQLPWRGNDPTAMPSAYAVWVSEVMLQQTRVEVVRDYYARWMKAFPQLEDLAQASEGEVLQLWQGLGYYSRARRLREGAQYVLQQYAGRLPEDPAELQTVPGIGPYSAGAISSIAYGKASALVDGNVIRVFSRLFALGGDPNKNPLKSELWRIAQTLVPQKQAGDFNQSVMELGATVCTPKRTSCHSCPLQKQCRAFLSGQVERFPELPKKAAPTPLSMALLLLRSRGRYAVLTLDETARWWSGLDAFPFMELQSRSGEEQVIEFAAQLTTGELKRRQALPVVKHTVTRFKIEMQPWVIELKGQLAQASRLRWCPLASLTELALPAPHRRVLESLSRWEHAGRPHD